MYHYAWDQLDPNQLKKILIGTVIPRPIALITTQSPEAVINIAPFSYFNLASYAPPVLMVSFIRQANGHLKDTPRNLLDTGEGVVHLVTADLVEDANLTSAPYPSDVSELEVTPWTLLNDTKGSVPRIQEASVAFEVTVDQVLPVKDGSHTASDIFLLKIKYVHLSEEIYDTTTGYIDYRALNPMSRLAGDDYANLGHITSLTRPTEGEI